MDTEPLSPGQRPARVVVLGGGLAGMAAAVHLLRHSFPVTLIERRPFLGGRTFSFVDRETGVQVDNGQHVFLGCCTAFISFLNELGVYHKAALQQRLKVRVFSPEGRLGVLSAAPLPPPLHLLPSFLLYPHMGLLDKLKALKALTRIWRSRRADHAELESQSFYHWLKEQGQSERAIQRFWNLITLPTLNDDIRNVSADMGFMIFREGLMSSRNAGAVGYPRVGLSALMGQPAQEYIRGHGGELLLGRSARRLAIADNRIQGVEMADDEAVRGDSYISALPFNALLEMLPEDLRRNPFFAPAGGLEWSPIVDLHIWYDRPVADFDFASFVDSPVQWVFNKSRIFSQDGPGQYICVSLSGAWEHWGRSKQELRDTFTRELARVLPRTRQATMERFIVVKEQRATFRPAPGAAAYRLPAQTLLDNLYLAGDWTDTGWPATMEGAVRSGVHAAQLVVARGPR